MFLTLGLAACTLVPPRVSQAGHALLAQLRRRHAALKTATGAGRALLAPPDAALAVALFGEVAASPAVRTLFTNYNYSAGIGD